MDIDIKDLIENAYNAIADLENELRRLKKIEDKLIEIQIVDDRDSDLYEYNHAKGY